MKTEVSDIKVGNVVYVPSEKRRGVISEFNYSTPFFIKVVFDTDPEGTIKGSGWFSLDMLEKV